MDGWGSLTMLLKRQNANKYRKADLRHQLQKRKEGFLKGPYENSEEEFNFPEVSRFEMEKIKNDIRIKILKEKRKKIGYYFLSILLILAFIALAVLMTV